MATHGKHVATGKPEKKTNAAAVPGAVVKPSGAPQVTSTTVKPATVMKPGKKNSNKPEPEHKVRSKRVRVALIVVAVLLLVAVGALGFLGYRFWVESQQEAELVAENATQAATMDASDANDAGASASRQATGEIESLPGLLGLTVDEVIAQVGDGATITATTDIIETKMVEVVPEPEPEPEADEAAEGEAAEGEAAEGEAEAEQEEEKPAEPVMQEVEEVVGSHVTVTLTEQGSDLDGSAPSIYLVTDVDGIVTEAGYSASVSSLGYGDESFTSIIRDDQIIEKTLAAAGVMVESGTIALPDDESEYRTYADDGTTITQEVYTFRGQGMFNNGASGNWTCRLTYDYSAANVSSNLDDTIRQIYVSVSPLQEEEETPSE